MLKACSYCGRIHDKNIKCSRQINRTNERTLRNKSKWHKKSEEIRGRSLNLCQVCLDKEGLLTYENLEVHHVIKLSDNPDGLLDDSNLISLCPRHHKQADAGQLDIDYLRSLILKRDTEGIL